MDAEQLSFEMDFETGEYKAPVSGLFKLFINQSIRTCLDENDETIYDFNIELLRNMINSSSLFSKTPKEFQKEVRDLLDVPFEQMYEHVWKKPLPKKEVSTNTNTKPNLKLVK